jgi:hypothetical protein
VAAPEYHTSVTFEVSGNIILFSNFFFVKKLFKLITRTTKDMTRKRQKLLSKVKDVSVLKNIESGFNYVQKLKQMAYQQMEALRKQKLLQQ